jgi:signal transduction histidine kinase/HPt (histidine-containing phosphotransfer) domain-containing protein/FixJ family two-component response regulator
MSDTGETQITSGSTDRFPVSARLLVVSFVLLVAVIGVAGWGERQASLYAEVAFGTQQRGLETARLLSLMQDTEIGQRGYLLTDDERYLQPYEAAISEIAQLRPRLKSIIGDNTAQLDRAVRLDQLITERLDYLARALRLHESGQRGAAIAIERSGEGKVRMDEIRAIIAQVNAAREKVLADQQARLDWTIVWVRVAGILGVILLVLTAAAIFRQSTLFAGAQRRVRESHAAAITAANAANRAKSAFLATMSHELRTPMTAIIGMCDLLLAGHQSADERQITQLLERNAQSLLRLLNDILDLSKIESGRLTFEKADFTLSSVLEEIKALFGPVASQKGLVLTVAANAGPKDVFRGDPKRLQQVMVNLVGNAIKFTLSGGVTVSNRQSVAPDGRTIIEIEVEDTGEGITDEAMNRLFREFEQEDVSTSRRYGGSGLGLSISKRIVENFGGSIGATSTKGRGSCFFFSLPLPDGDPAKISSRPAGAGADASRQLAGLRLNILLAEDTPATQFLVSRMLTLWGHAVTAAGDGIEALRVANERRWDIILMDMQMPLMDGPQATRLIRSGNGPSADVPIIALTADAVIGNRRIYLEAGCNVVCTKPIDWAILADHIARLVGHVDVAAPPAPPPSPSSAALQAHWRDLPLVNRPLLDELADSLGKDTVSSLVAAAVENLRAYVVQLRKLADAGDVAQMSRLAHQIKGASGQVGAERVSGIARVIESESKAGAVASAAVAAIDEALKETSAALDAYFERAGENA